MLDPDTGIKVHTSANVKAIIIMLTPPIIQDKIEAGPADFAA